MPSHSRRKENVPNASKKKLLRNVENRLNALKSENVAELRKKLKNNDCFLGVIPHTQLSNLTVTCRTFSVVVQYNSKLITFFVTRKKIIILDPSCTLVKTAVPNTITRFLNSMISKRKIIIAKIAKAIKPVLKLCFKFLSALYSGLSVSDVIALLNLILI